MDTPQLYHLIPEIAWQPTYADEQELRDGAGVVELSGILRDKKMLTGWPAQMRVIVRRERPHPGIQLRFDDVDGYR